MLGAQSAFGYPSCRAEGLIKIETEEKMKDAKYLYFREIPKEFKKNEKLIVGLLEFSGIQSFIFGAVNVYSEKEEIKARSEYVSRASLKIYEMLSREIKSRYKLRALTMSGAKLMVAVSPSFKVKRLEEIFSRVQRIVYAETEGALEAYFGICTACVSEKENKNTDFSAERYLRLLVNDNKYSCRNLVNFPMENYRLGELDFLNFLRKYNLGKPRKEESFAALKMDLDNLGSFFTDIRETDVRIKTGRALERILEGAVKSTEGVFPVFVGGDDIFVLIESENFYTVAAKLYENIKCGIFGAEELVHYRSSFGISAGMTILRRDLGGVLVFYYSDLCETELENAKHQKGKNVLSFDSVIVSWEQISLIGRIMEENFDDIISGLDINQKLIVLSRVRELCKKMIGDCRIFLSREEEKSLESI